MILVELFCIIIAFMCFPITLYTIFVTFKLRFKKGERNVYFEILLYIMLFLLMCFYADYKINEFICCLNLPTLVAFKFHKTKTAVNLCIINLLFLRNDVYHALYAALALYSIYFIIYFLYKKYNLKEKILTFLFSLITCIFIIISMALYEEYSFSNISIILIFLSTTYLLSFIIDKIGNILHIYKTLNEMKKDKQLRVSISKISHEIKNPLFVIKGYLEVLDNNNIIESKHVLLDEVTYALDILSDFKELNKLNINKEVFIFNDILDELKYEIIPFYSNKNIKSVFYSDDNINICADKKRIKQVLINIIKNSIESVEYNGKIFIKSMIVKNNLIIIVKDNGKGMDNDTLNNLFTPFYTKKESGTGLGLCLSKEIIEEHNGTISYESELKKYTKVKIVLPLNNKDNMAYNK